MDVYWNDAPLQRERIDKTFSPGTDWERESRPISRLAKPNFAADIMKWLMPHTTGISNGKTKSLSGSKIFHAVSAHAINQLSEIVSLKKTAFWVFPDKTGIVVDI
ncbi:TPA: hypothetical protein ACJGHA_004663 [Salmonella enterica subsp. enterica serovar Poona]